MTPDDVRAAAEQLVDFHERFAPLFGKEQAQDHAYDYLKGLMVCPERKSIEPIALNVGHGDVSGLQKFVNIAPWDLRRRPGRGPGRLRRRAGPLGRRHARSASSGSSTRAASPRRAMHSAGVARQHNGRLGKEDNCQVGVFLVGRHPRRRRRCWTTSSTCPRPGASRRPRPRDRRDEGPHPRGRRLPHQAADRRRADPQTSRCWARSTLDWVVADEEYGTNGDFLDEVERLEQRYVVEVPVDDDRLDRGPGGVRPAVLAAGAACRRARRREAVRARWPRSAAGLPAAGVAGAAGPRGGEGAAGLRVRGGAGLGGAAPQAGAAGLAADPPVAGGRARGQVLRLQRRRRDAAGGAGAGGLHAGTGGGVLRGRQELPGDGAVRDAVVGRLAPPHERWWRLAHLFVTLTRRALEKKRRS